MIRVAALVSHPIEYFAPLFQHVGFLPEIDLTLTMTYTADLWKREWLLGSRNSSWSD